ncbi:MAG TPA: hypothetical protein VFP49_01025 [Nitrososphaeraceae archaeon]|nr:hypothetical protein [Nitrososphaeraceae archaeon]
MKGVAIMNYNYPNPKHKDFYNDLEELDHNFTYAGLIDNLFLDLCRAKTDTNIRGKLVNISVIIPDKEGQEHVTVNKYFDYAIRNTPRIIIGQPSLPFIIDKEDSRPDIIKEIESLHPFIAQNILKQTVLKIFEITSPHICYFSIAPRLKVEIRKLKT